MRKGDVCPKCGGNLLYFKPCDACEMTNGLKSKKCRYCKCRLRKTAVKCFNSGCAYKEITKIER